MRAVTIGSMSVLLALLTLGQPHAPGQGSGESDCLSSATEKPAVYCESIEIGNIALATKNFTATFVVRFESKFFSGLEHVRTSHGSEFRKAGHPVSSYPGEFTLGIVPPLDLNQLGKPLPAPLPLPAVRLPPEMQPRRVVVRWLDSRQRVLATKSTDLEQVEESWTELRQPRVWYRATIRGVNQALASGLEVLVTGDGETLLGTMHGRL